MNSQKLLISLVLSLVFITAGAYKYAPTETHPFGQYNPSAPTAIKDFAPLIGQAKCESTRRIDQNNWADPVDMIWTFRYILNGHAVQDSTLKSDGTHGGSLRQYDVEKKQWNVHYYTQANTPLSLPNWQGGKVGHDLVFWREQQAPNGLDGFYRLTFSQISDQGYQWAGEWVDQGKSMVYPTWKISCNKLVSNPPG